MQEIVIGSERVSVGELIGKGGEGEIFAVKGHNDQAVKIYNTGLRAKRENKVRAMIKEGLSTKTNLVAYPIEIACDRHRNFIGFLMRLVSGYRPVHELYSPKSRQRHFPKADYRFIIRGALNCARSIGKVHQTGCVIGDLNHSGILVSQDATIAIIDADSFQFRLNGNIYPCVVGVPDFTPPELHGANLGTVVRTVEQDNFGLAVLIFHLLFMGRHPYAGQYNGPDISMSEAIAQNRFAFSLKRRQATKTTPPPGALTLDLFPEPINNAFEQAFGLSPSARPSASDWIVALTKLEGSLSRCSKVESHYYPSNAKSCIWCELSSKSGFDMFPDRSTASPYISSGSRGTEQAISEILTFCFPSVADLLPQSFQPMPTGSNALRKAKNKKYSQAILGLLMIAGAIAGCILATPVWFIWLILGSFGWAIVGNRKVDIKPFQDAYQNADKRVQRELDSFIRRNSLTEVFQVRNDLDAAIASYKSIDESLANEVKKLKSTRKARQLTAYLDQFSVRNANISGIGPVKTATLISFGIETAADVKKSTIIRVPGFGEVMTGKLLDWRRRLESRFRYNSMPNAQDVIDEKALKTKFSNQKAKLEAIIHNGLTTLRTAKPRLEILIAKASSDMALTQAVKDRSIAEQDLKMIGATIPNSTVAFNIKPPPQHPTQPKQAVQLTVPSPPSSIGSLSVPNCPRCGSPMRHKSGRYGQFWGCSRYPGCRGTRNI